MITVAILINNKPLFSRTAVNVTKKDGGALKDGRNIYYVDDGSRILHHPDKGAVELAIKMLNTIKECK